MVSMPRALRTSLRTHSTCTVTWSYVNCSGRNPAWTSALTRSTSRLNWARAAAVPAVSEHFDDDEGVGEAEVNANNATFGVREHFLSDRLGDAALRADLQEATFEPGVSATGDPVALEDVDELRDAVAPAGSEGDDAFVNAILSGVSIAKRAVQRNAQTSPLDVAAEVDELPGRGEHRDPVDPGAVNRVEIDRGVDVMAGTLDEPATLDRDVERRLDDEPVPSVDARRGRARRNRPGARSRQRVRRGRPAWCAPRMGSEARGNRLVRARRHATARGACRP